MSEPDITDPMDSDETDGEPEEPTSEGRRGFDPERVAARMDEKRRRKNAPLDLEATGVPRTAGQMKVVETYEECLERGMTAVAERLQNAPTRSKQDRYAKLVRHTDYQVTAAEIDEKPATVKARYRGA